MWPSVHRKAPCRLTAAAAQPSAVGSASRAAPATPPALQAERQRLGDCRMIVKVIAVLPLDRRRRAA